MSYNKIKLWYGVEFANWCSALDYIYKSKKELDFLFTECFE